MKREKLRLPWDPPNSIDISPRWGLVLCHVKVEGYRGRERQEIPKQKHSLLQEDKRASRHIDAL